MLRIKIGIIEMIILFVLFMLLACMGVSMKGILIAYFVLLGVTIFLTLCLLMYKKRQRRNKDAQQ